MAYSEQEGKNLHDGTNHGEITLWYILIIKINSFAINYLVSFKHCKVNTIAISISLNDVKLFEEYIYQRV
jgi:hypothetical protein